MRVWPKLYEDLFTCPKCRQTRIIIRKRSVAGKNVKSYCIFCRKSSKAQAGPVPVAKT